MPKSPHFAAIRKALQVAARLEAAHAPTSLGLEQMAEQHARPAARKELTRRGFLQLAGAAALATAAGPQIGLPALRREALPSVVIVGAGLAGLTAAYRLRQAGIVASIYEASNRFGGRVQTARGVFDGQSGEIGGEFIDTGHESIRRLVKEMSLGEVDLIKEDGQLTRDTFFFNGQILDEQKLIEDFRPVARAIIDDLATLTGDDATYDAPNGAEKLDQMSIAEWFDARGITGDIRRVLEIAYIGEYGLEIAEQNVFNLLWLIGTDEGQLALYGASDERFHILGGNDQLATRVAARLARPVELNAALEAIRPGANNGYVLSFRQDGASKTVSADAVILTIPFLALRKVDLTKLEIPDNKRNAINTLGYGVNSKVMDGFTDRVWRFQATNGSVFTDLPFQATWETFRYQDPGSGVLTSFLGGRQALAVLDMDPSKAAADFASQLEKIYPGAQKAFTGKYYIADWPKRPFIQSGYSCYKPGQVTTIRGLEKEPVGNLFFAGEHTSLEAQGYMEGGVESGERAAKELLAAFGIGPKR